MAAQATEEDADKRDDGEVTGGEPPPRTPMLPARSTPPRPERAQVWTSEVDAVILDRAFGQRMEALFAADVARSRRIDPVAWSDRPLADRLGEWTARPLRQLL